MKRFLLSLFLCSSIIYSAPHVKFEHEPELIFIFENPHLFRHELRQEIGNYAATFIKNILDKHAAGRIQISNEDCEYLNRICYMAADILSYDGYLEDEPE